MRIRVLLPLFLLLPLTLINQAYAQRVHVWHLLKPPVTDTWSVRAVVLSSTPSAYFTDADKNAKGQVYDFMADGSKETELGYGFDFEKPDYDMAYAVTMTQKSSGTSVTFKNKSCVFTVTAQGPAMHDIRIQAYNGAVCEYQEPTGHHLVFIAK